jgi:hypothetical protein
MPNCIGKSTQIRPDCGPRDAIISATNAVSTKISDSWPRLAKTPTGKIDLTHAAKLALH